ncbi:MAG TPA: ATP-binding cassette domain-containing protein [Candidatus Eisenbacteria bacterium]|nr:ATP-binding cassette domain-containing protein [Candidatus Eisenbacteria bacterium]
MPDPWGGAPRVVLRDLEVSFRPGEIHRVLGANGSGKSTLLRLLAGLRAPASGRVLLDGEPIPRRGSLWPRIAILFEEPDPQFLTESVEAEIAFGLESLALPPAEIRARTREALASFDLEPLERRDPLTLSGGEKARVLLAAALAAKPEALLLDQALAHLDPGTRGEIEARLAGEARERGLLLVHARQDLERLHPGERVHRIREGRLVRETDANEGAWNATAVEARVGSRRSAEARAAGPRAAGEPGEIALALDRVSWRPARGEGAFELREITLEVRGGETVALVGRSGAGKTTILKVAAGLLTPTSGQVRTPSRGNEVPATGRAARERATGLALEYPERQLFGRTAGEDVAALLWVDGVPEAERRSRARAAMESVGLDPAVFEERAPATLSEGEKRRVAIAGLLVDPPRAILLDEPTAGLDLEGRHALAAALDACRRLGHAILLASHDHEFVARVADRIAVVGARGVEAGALTLDFAAKRQTARCE